MGHLCVEFFAADQGSLTLGFTIYISMVELAYPGIDARDIDAVFNKVNDAMSAATLESDYLQNIANMYLLQMGGGLQHNLQAVGYHLNQTATELNFLHTPPHSSSNDDDLSAGEIVGIVFGVLAFIGLVTAGLFWYFRIYRTRNEQESGDRNGEDVASKGKKKSNKVSDVGLDQDVELQMAEHGVQGGAPSGVQHETLSPPALNPVTGIKEAAIALEK